MATVFRALDRLSQRKVALKLLHPRDARDQQTERFAREAQLIAELSHPGIVAYVAHGQTPEGEPFLAMEWLQGEDLAERLRRGPLRLSEALTLLRRVADSLSAAHRRGIVHRDLKPSNLFLRDSKVERVTLLDFGLARPILGAPTLINAGVLIGTPGYMAPEQARGERDLGPSVDIFSLGCVIYECLTGEPPFVAEHFVALLAKILFDAAPKARDLCPELPEAFGALLDRMLAKEPSARPSDAMALLSALSRLAEIDPEILATTQTVRAMAPGSIVGLEQQLFSVVIAVKAAGDTRSARILCLSECATQLIFSGRYGDAHALIEALSRDAADSAAEGPQAAALLHQMRAFHASAAGDPGACLSELKAALAAFEQAGDLRDACALSFGPATRLFSVSPSKGPGEARPDKTNAPTHADRSGCRRSLDRRVQTPRQGHRVVRHRLREALVSRTRRNTAAKTTPGTVKLWESLRQSRGFSNNNKEGLLLVRAASARGTAAGLTARGGAFMLRGEAFIWGARPSW